MTRVAVYAVQLIHAQLESRLILLRIALLQICCVRQKPDQASLDGQTRRVRPEFINPKRDFGRIRFQGREINSQEIELKRIPWEKTKK